MLGRVVAEDGDKPRLKSAWVPQVPMVDEEPNGCARCDRLLLLPTFEKGGRRNKPSRAKADIDTRRKTVRMGRVTPGPEAVYTRFIQDRRSQTRRKTDKKLAEN